MSRPLNGSFDQICIGFGEYMQRWFNGIYADYIDTKGVKAFLERPFRESVKWVPSRMIDEAEAMLEAYRKNENGPPGKSTLFPIVLMAIDTNFITTGADWGGQQISRRLAQIEEGGSWYGYKHVMQDRRVQVVIIASEGGTAQSLAAQLSSFVAEPHNRYLSAPYEFGQYKVRMPITQETNRIDWMDVKTDAKNIKIFAADFTLKCTVPFFDAPKAGEPNDGTDHNPPGFPLVGSYQQVAHATEDGIRLWDRTR